MWLVVMLVIMPLTSAGPFASALPDGAAAAILGYLAISVSFGLALAIARTWIDVDGDPERTLTLPALQRRALLGALGGTGAAYVAAFASGMLLPSSARAPAIVLLDPQEPVPSGGLDEPNPHPQVVSAPVAQPAAAPTPTVAANATPALPKPVAARTLQRDKDGAVCHPVGRPVSLRPRSPATTTSTSSPRTPAATRCCIADDWRLLVDGEVQRAFQLDYAACASCRRSRSPRRSSASATSSPSASWRPSAAT